MIRLLSLTLLALCSTLVIFAQSEEKETEIPQYLDLAIGSNGNENMASLSYMHTWGVGKKKNLQLTYGLRFSTYRGKDIEFYSAPPEFYGIPEKTDTIIIAAASQSNIALFIGATYRIKNKLELGFNIDGLGYTFGPDRSYDLVGDMSQVMRYASPNQISALLVGSNDIGMIKAEFFVAYSLNPHWMVRLGVSNSFVEYKTKGEIQAGNTRFRGDPFMPMLGLRYKL